MVFGVLRVGGLQFRQWRFHSGGNFRPDGGLQIGKPGKSQLAGQPDHGGCGHLGAVCQFCDRLQPGNQMLIHQNSREASFRICQLRLLLPDAIPHQRVMRGQGGNFAHFCAILIIRVETFLTVWIGL